MGQPNEQGNIIQATTQNSIKIDIELRAIQENACRETMTSLYDETLNEGRLNKLFGCGRYLLGAGVSGLIQWFTITESPEAQTLAQFVKSNLVFLILIAVGMVGELIRKKTIEGIGRKDRIIKKHMESSEWKKITNPTVLMLQNDNAGRQDGIPLYDGSYDDRQKG